MTGGNRESAPLSPERLQKIYDAQSRLYTTLNSIDAVATVVVANFIIAVVAIGVVLGLSYATRGPLLLAAATATAGVAAAAAVWVTRRLRRLDPRGYTQVMLERGLCPGCAYTLAGLAPEGGGLVKCPECGAAWPVAALAPGGTAGNPVP